MVESSDPCGVKNVVVEGSNVRHPTLIAKDSMIRRSMDKIAKCDFARSCPQRLRGELKVCAIRMHSVTGQRTGKRHVNDGRPAAFGNHGGNTWMQSTSATLDTERPSVIHPASGPCNIKPIAGNLRFQGYHKK